MRVLLIGGAGQLGSDLELALKAHEVAVPIHTLLEITDEAAVYATVVATAPEAVVNTAAFHDVPRCETSPARAFAVNALGPLHLARACKRVNARLIQISTDYVFDGSKGEPYEERDAPAPLSVYGASKLAGEHLARAENPRTIVVRTTGLFGQSPCRAKSGGRNFVETMLHLARTRGELNVVEDESCCPTYTVDLAVQIRRLLEEDAPPGVYHAVNGPGLSWLDFATMILERAGEHADLRGVRSETLARPVRRPRDSRLSTVRLGAMGLLEMRPLPEALSEYLAARRSSEAAEAA
jgi:dTDP-4-dehydrorhamnose reductase